MIAEILKDFEPNLSTLSWYDKYGGLTKLVSEHKENDVGKKTTVQYPVSDYLTNADCWQNNRHKDLVPDESFKSIIYFEEHTAESLVHKGSQARKFHELTASVRLIAWANLRNFDTPIDTGGYRAEMIQDMHDIFNTEAVIASSLPRLKNLKTRITSIDTADYTRSTVFGKYNYGNVDAIFFYPFEVLSMTIRVNAWLC